MQKKTPKKNGIIKSGNEIEESRALAERKLEGGKWVLSYFPL